jgi:hypothetical protein
LQIQILIWIYPTAACMEFRPDGILCSKYGILYRNSANLVWPYCSTVPYPLVREKLPKFLAWWPSEFHENLFPVFGKY